ncbi:MAG: hypothetical protein ACK4UN_21065 [Limisphaerales bacterium]
MRGYSFFLLVILLWVTGCKDVNQGQSSANETPVSDGQIVLLKRTNEIAAFILKNQRPRPEETDFTWFYRSDGNGTFAPGDPAVTSGTATNATAVSFSTFSVGWSIHTDGMGWVYFSTLPTEFSKTADFAMCVTSETNLAAINANDRRWKYRSRPGVNLKALVDSQLKR